MFIFKLIKFVEFEKHGSRHRDRIDFKFCTPKLVYIMNGCTKFEVDPMSETMFFSLHKFDLFEHRDPIALFETDFSSDKQTDRKSVV